MNNDELIKYVKKAKGGDSKAFGELYVLTYDEAKIVASTFVKDTHSIEDIVHDVYVKVLENLPKLRNDAGFKTWFRRIVTNTCKDFLAKKKPELFSSLDFGDGFEEDFDQRLADAQSIEHPVSEFPEIEEVSEKIVEALKVLPDEQRLCVLMHYYGYMTAEEIARTLGVSRSTVLSRLSYAKKKLKKELNDDRDSKLFGIALFPFVQSIEIAPETLETEADAELLAKLMASAEAEALFAGSTAGIIAKIAELSLLKKIICVIAAVAVGGGIAAAVISKNANDGKAHITTGESAVTAVTSEGETASDTAGVTGAAAEQKGVYSGGSLILKKGNAVFFSDGESVYTAAGSADAKEKIAPGSAGNFVADGENVYFIADGTLYKYGINQKAVIQKESVNGEYLAYGADALYCVSLIDKEISRINEALKQEPFKKINGSSFDFNNNSVMYYRGSNLYCIDFLNITAEKMLIDGSSMNGMKPAFQIEGGAVYYPEFDSDTTGVLNINGAAVKLKRGFTDFLVCKNSVLYTATDGGTYRCGVNGENEAHISDIDYSFTAYVKPYALCYDAKSDTSVLINTETGGTAMLSKGFVQKAEADGDCIYYRLGGTNYIKKL